ncbi:MAG: hypothetical protein MN733_20565 [Nitrososphaera sp.]|nr:hypothetical protein [Nitrososphaera sp.]
MELAYFLLEDLATRIITSEPADNKDFHGKLYADTTLEAAKVYLEQVRVARLVTDKLSIAYKHMDNGQHSEANTAIGVAEQTSREAPIPSYLEHELIHARTMASFLTDETPLGKFTREVSED